MNIEILILKSLKNFLLHFSFNFPSRQYRSYSESLRNVSLLLLNSHFSTTAPRPLLPNVKEVGGIQIKSNPWPLPEVRVFLILIL